MYQDMQRNDPMANYAQSTYDERGPQNNAHPNLQQVDAIKPAQQPGSGFRDWPFAILFILNVAAIVTLGILYGSDAFQRDTDNQTTTNTLSSSNATAVLIVSAGLAVAALGIAIILVRLLVAFARPMITFCLWFSVAISFLVAAYAFSVGSVVFGVLALILAVLNLLYARAVRPRIPFAAANLKVAAAAIKKHSTTYVISILFTIIQIIWIVAWAIAALGVINQYKSETRVNGNACFIDADCVSNICRDYGNNIRRCVTKTDDPSSGNYASYFFLLLSLYWGLQVFKNLSHTSIAGTVATFWFHSDSSGASGASLKRACTTSLGSVCLGSLIVAILQALRSLAQNAREEGSVLACIAECILGCLESLMEYFNRWAFVYVGIYGTSFAASSKSVMSLFRSRGFDAIINDDLISNVLSFAALAVGLVCAAAGVILAKTVPSLAFSSNTIILGILGFFIGVGIATTPLSVIDSSVATIFVCFAEDPAAFLRAHPDLYALLVSEWGRMYPNVISQAGYYV